MDQQPAMSVTDISATLSSILIQSSGELPAIREPAFAATVNGLYGWLPRRDVDAAVELARAQTGRDVARA